MSAIDRITIDPEVMGGKACIRGLRVTVGTVVGLLAAGRSPDEILRAYPYLVSRTGRRRPIPGLCGLVAGGTLSYSAAPAEPVNTEMKSSTRYSTLTATTWWLPTCLQPFAPCRVSVHSAERPQRGCDSRCIEVVGRTLIVRGVPRAR